MTSRLPEALQHSPALLQPRTVVMACSEEHGVPERMKSLLRRHALVLRTHGGRVPHSPDGPLGALLQSKPIERLIVMAHSPCPSSEPGGPEPARSTAAVRAWFRHAPAAHALTEAFAAGAVTKETLAAKLGLLVRMANVHACPQADRALQQGRVTLAGVFWDASREQLERFDGMRFVPMDELEVRRLITGGRLTERGASAFGRVPTPVASTGFQSPSGETTGGMA